MLQAIEILENRIAPAVFFVSGTDLTVHNSSGGLVAGDTAAATAAGALLAIPLSKGDSLVFDANNNHHLDPHSDYVMFSVTGGKAIAFLTDTNSDSKFEPQDFTGVAAGDGFKGTLNGDLHGDFATLLDTAGTFNSTTIQPDSIAGLTINGHILGNIVAGKNISNITAKIPAGSDPLALSVSGNIDAGDSVTNTLSFNGGGTTLTPTYTAGAGEVGATISKINLPGGVSIIQAGNGGVGSGKGGSILNVTLGGDTPVDLLAGKGGAAATTAGGNGGDIVGVKIVTRYTGGDFYIYGGNGGASNTGSGGNGGMISGLSFTSLNDTSHGADFYGGTGGAGGGTGTGGAGGALQKSSFSLARSGSDIYIYGGNGGSGGSGGGSGGAGGSISALTVLAHGSTTNNGNSYYSSSLKISGGFGGSAEGAGGTGGAGGANTGLKLNTDGVFGDGITVQGGGGGSGGSGAGNGGIGGNLTKVSATVGGTLETSALFEAGNGGAGGGTSGNGGAGGNTSFVTATNLGYVRGLYSYAGTGGATANGSSSGNGGAGGFSKNVTLTNKGGSHSVGIYSENGGRSNSATGNGGSGGDLSNATINNLAFVGSGDIYLGSYYGGSASTAGNGGDGGNATNLKINDTFQGTGNIYIYAGSGSNGAGASGKGGNAGNLSNAVVNAPLSHVDVGYYGSTGNGESAGGNGGMITNVSGIAHILQVQAYDGGTATTGAGGHGGEVSKINFKVTDNAQLIAAGDGGSTTTGTPGTGGSVKMVTIQGDIGNFNAAFGTGRSDSNTEMGGLVAGKGGALNGVYNSDLNGSIANVTASRIATIVAGAVDDSNVASTNAVLSITGIKATQIGADLNHNGVWDYTEGGSDTSFQLSDAPGADGDTVIDGLVLVKVGGFVNPPVTPLKLIQV